MGSLLLAKPEIDPLGSGSQPASQSVSQPSQVEKRKAWEEENNSSLSANRMSLSILKKKKKGIVFPFLFNVLFSWL